MAALSCLPESHAADVVTLPDPKTGVINGKVALLLWPSTQTTDGGRTLLKADGCEVHFAPSDAQEQELLYACGKWFEPPVGRYVAWTEQGNFMSPPTVMINGGEKFNGLGHILVTPMFPAGWFRVDDSTVVPAGTTIRLISMTLRSRFRPFDRQIRQARRGDRVRVPAGAIVAGVFDSEGRALSLSRPVKITEGQTVTVRPVVPAESPGVVSIVGRRPREGPFDPPCVTRLVSQDGLNQQSDAEIQGYDRIVSVWYNVSINAVRFTLDCGTERIEKDLKLTRGAITTIRDEFQTTSKKEIVR